MKRFIFGFHRRVWWPKWTPASSSCRMETTAINVPPVGCSPRAPRPSAERRPWIALGCVLVGAAAHLLMGLATLADRLSPPNPGPRVGPFVDRAQALLAHVRIDLRGAQAGVSEQ